MSVLVELKAATLQPSSTSGEKDVSLVINAGLALLERYWGGLWKDAAFILQAASNMLAFIVIARLLAVIYKMLLQVKLSWHDVSIGALGTDPLFIFGNI